MPRTFFLLLLSLASPAALAAGTPATGVPVEFILFGATLLGVALFHRHTLGVALAGLGCVTHYKLCLTGFKTGAGLAGLALHLGHEWVTLVNLLGLLMGFALLARHFEKSHIPLVLPRYLPDDWKGGFMLLIMVYVLSGFLDNIAAALIGGAMAHQLFRARVHVGYLAAIVAASNAGGAGSVVGDTTTTMMWISGISPFDVVHAYLPSFTALLIVAWFGARQQHAYSPILRSTRPDIRIDWARVGIVGLMLLMAVATNIVVNTRFPEISERFPFLAAAVWSALLLTAGVRRHDWALLPQAFKGALFLLALVLCASMMPVEALPTASWSTALGLGFVSSLFDNIPLTALALRQGGFDWGLLAYCVGFGGSMLWFGSSAGVALSNMYPEARSAGTWLRQGWHVPLAYLAGFAVVMAVLGWHPAPAVGPAPVLPASSTPR
ncbi:citrate transporter [Uliginosibacterium paludis]|uniref:Citrate transporter n=1 Tax=Uliginosibacterium paludis TaxID=1615952 RepID=A0ABV2CK30_9RHOO